MFRIDTTPSWAARTTVPDEDSCGTLDDSNIRLGDAPSQSARKSTEAWISVEDNKEVLTTLQLDMQEEDLEAGHDRAPDGGTKY